MSNNKNTEFKEITVAEKKFFIIKLDPWRRLTFIADFQKDFLIPVINSIGEEKISGMLNNSNAADFDFMSVITSLSGVIDGSTIEKWTKRILNEGLVIYLRDDEKKAKLAFVELNDFFTNPIDILMLMKDAIMFNLEGVTDLFSNFKQSPTLAEG
ncbi:phage tail assembly chaperone [Morganella morganii]|uniref:phage tail assembly chaperone n=1 Tax=Morganella TaxID=581 RepID=UPI001C441B32|nr:MULTISPECIES: hypothetical protein [Morganella]QXO67056.1 hypothetical protein JC825_09170 [Morganella morganii]